MSTSAHMSGRDELLTAFGIGVEDLEANRAGRLGPRQLRALRLRTGWRIAGTVAGAAVLAVTALLGTGPDRLRYGPAGLIAVVAVAVIVHSVRTVRAAGRPDVVGSLAGPVHAMLLFRHNEGWWLTVEGRSFRLPVPFSHIEDGAGYRVYYRRAGHRIVAIEPTPDPPPSTVD